MWSTKLTFQSYDPLGPWDNLIWQLFDKDGNTPGCAMLDTSASWVPAISSLPDNVPLLHCLTVEAPFIARAVLNSASQAFHEYFQCSKPLRCSLYLIQKLVSSFFWNADQKLK